MIDDNPRPHLCRAAVVFFDHLMQTTDTVCEFGSGNSTPWLEERCEYLVSVEHDVAWHEAVLQATTNAIVLLADEDRMHECVGRYRDGYFDLVYVDCLWPQRLKCVRAAVPKLKDGGWMVLDDAHLPTVAEALGELDWDCVRIEAKKMHSTRDEYVDTSTVFCRKGKRCGGWEADKAGTLARKGGK